MESTALSAVCAGRKGRVRLVGASGRARPPCPSQHEPEALLAVLTQECGCRNHLGRGKVIYFDKGRPWIIYSERKIKNSRPLLVDTMGSGG